MDLKNKEARQTIIDVLNILENKQSRYSDPAEHIYDGMKIIKRHLNEDDLILYVDDFIWALSSEVNGDFDGTLSKCIEMLRTI